MGNNKSKKELEKEIELLRSQLESLQKKENLKKNSKGGRKWIDQKNQNDLIRENRKKYYEKNIDKWINQSKKRLIKFLKDGFDPGSSEFLSGLRYRGDRSLLVKSLNEDEKFKDQYTNLTRKNRMLRGSHSPSKQKYEWDKNHLEQLKKYKEDFLNQNPQLKEYEPNPVNILSREPGGLSNTRKILPKYEHYFKTIVDYVIHRWEIITNKSLVSYKSYEKGNKDVLDLIPENLRILIHSVGRERKSFYDVNNKIIVKKCSRCDQYKHLNEYQKKGIRNNRISDMCVTCIVKFNRRKKGLPEGRGKLGEVRNGKIIKKWNEVGTLIERRCTSCDQFKEVKKFKYLHRSSSVCEDCYVQLPNNKLTRYGEYYRGELMRKFNKYNEVVEKKCRRCNTFYPLENFQKNKNNPIDGRGRRCKSCLKEIGK